MRNLIINADDFGYSKENNEAVLRGLESGIVTSCSLMVNMPGFEDALNIIKKLLDTDIGFHFNIMEGESLTNSNLLSNSRGVFNKDYVHLLLHSKNKNYIKQIEDEFKAQIERALHYCRITHIDSHVHIHSIPEIFEIFVKMAKEYDIKYIRTQNEIPYLSIRNSLDIKFIPNILKNILLNTLSNGNKNELKKFGIKTNDYIIGVLYTGMMDENTILKGLKRIKKDNTVTEILFHPYFDENNADKRNNYREYLITQNPNLKENIKKLGFALTKYSDL